jgi:integrase
MEASANFLSACQSPPQAGAVPARWFVYQSIRPPAEGRLSTSAKATKTRASHVKWLRLLQDRMAELMLHDASLTDAIEFVMLKESLRAGWSPQTLARYLAAIVGAFADIPLYSTTRWPLLLNQCPCFRACLKAADAAARAAPPTRNIPPMSLDNVMAILAAEPDPATRALIILSWVTCGRLGDIAQLTVGNVRVSRRPDCTKLSVRFMAGKTVRKGDPYTVDTQLSPEWATEIEVFLAGRAPTESVFPLVSDSRDGVTARGTTAIRRVCPDQEARSLRRGALQTLAAADAKIETLLLFSGHKTPKTLYRYLNWGQVESGTAAAAAVHAAALLPARH